MPKPKPRPKPKPKPPGFLTIAAKPYATVYIDGKKLGVTPIVSLELSSGTHSVRAISSEDGTEKKFRVRVTPGETTRKKVVW